MTAAGILRLDRVAKRYWPAGPWVLEEVEAVVEAGTVTLLSGRNGAGKSTLLRIVAGATEPSRGRRTLVARARVGYAPDRLAPAPPFTAEAFLRHHLRLRGLGGDGGTVVGGLAERLGFAQLLPQRMAALSRGSLQKIVLAQALLGEPALLVLDEPFGGLDREAAAALRELVAERAAAGAAVLASDHGEGGARLDADRGWLVRDGGIEHVAATGARERRRVRVPAQASDATLAELLAEGWHVLRVTPAGDACEIEAER